MKKIGKSLMTNNNLRSKMIRNILLIYKGSSRILKLSKEMDHMARKRNRPNGEKCVQNQCSLILSKRDNKTRKYLQKKILQEEMHKLKIVVNNRTMEINTMMKRKISLISYVRLNRIEKQIVEDQLLKNNKDWCL